jgi:NDP-sugar pyrophosphorylase family protein
MDFKILKNIPENREVSLEREIFPEFINLKEPAYGYLFKNYWIDTGTPKKYKKVTEDILEGKVKLNIEGKYRGNYFGKKIKFGKNLKIEAPTVIGDNCKIGNSVKVYKSIIFENTIIGDGSEIYNCIIGKNCLIEKNSFLKEIILGDNTKISYGGGSIF